MCNVKTIKGEVDIIIPFAKIEPNGLITNTQVHFEELLMSVNVKSIKYGNPHAKSCLLYTSLVGMKLSIKVILPFLVS